MRVLLVSQEMPPDTGWGGIGSYVAVLSEALSNKGVEVHVLSVADGQERSTDVVGGVHVHRLPLVKARGIGRISGLVEAVRRITVAANVAARARGLPERPTVVEYPEWNAEGLLLRRSQPLVCRLHSSARQLFPFTGQGGGLRGLDGRIAARMEDATARRANCVISTDVNLQESLPNLRLDPDAVHRIPVPVRLPAHSELPADAPPRIVFVGRLEPRKGPEVVLRAAPRVLQAVPEARFAFVGRDGTEPGAPSSADWLRAEAERLGVAHAVELLGPRDPQGVEAELRRATVAAFPSLWESFGNAVAEASAVGRPVVASSIAPFRALVADGETGVLMDDHDPDAWGAAIAGLLQAPDRGQAMGAAGAARVAGISDPARVADLTIHAYESAIDRFRDGRRAGV